MEGSLRKPGIWILVETKDGHGAEVGYEMLNLAQVLAVQNRYRLVALVIGFGVEEVAWESVRYGADSAILVDNSAYQTYDGAVFAETILRLYRRYQPELLLIGTTPQGVDLANRLAEALEGCVIQDYDALSLFQNRRRETADGGGKTPRIGLVQPGDFRKCAYNAALMGNIVDGVAQMQKR